MHYRSIEDLNATIAGNLHRVPRDVELVVGIPRSGLLAANLVAMHLNLPLADLDGYREGRLLRGRKGCGSPESVADFRRIAVIDDSVFSGNAMRKAKAVLDGLAHDRVLYFGAVYAAPEAGEPVDFFFEECPSPRAFEWNMMHHAGILRSACVEIDGVLCRRPTAGETQDIEAFRNFARHAEPLVPCSSRIKMIVSGRPEALRGDTERWLGERGIECRQLILLGGRDIPEAKARIYGADRENLLFIEGDPEQAREIANRTGKPVFCANTRRMIGPSGAMGTLRSMRNRGISFAGRFLPDPVRERLKRKGLPLPIVEKRHSRIFRR
jgi:orotate phosphoribosyltransferase